MHERFSVLHRFYSIVGVPIFAKHNWDSKFWLILQILNFFIEIICIVSTTGFVIMNVSDLLLFIQGACIWTIAVIMIVSSSICLYFRRDFRDSLNEMAFQDNMVKLPLVRMVLKMESGAKLTELRRLVEQTQTFFINSTRILFKAYITISWVCVAMYLCIPIYQMTVTNDSSLRLLAFDMWFPWSLQNFKIYVATFILHAHCAMMAAIAIPCFQATIGILIGQVIRQLRIMTFILLHLDELVTEITGKDERWQQTCIAVFVQCFKHYIILKRFLYKLNGICRPFYLSLILVAMILVGMCSVKISISNKLALETVKYYLLELYFVSMMLLFSLLGQQVDTECKLLEQAVTEKWYTYNKAHKQNVLIFHMALSQRMPIYIFGSITLSTPTFIWFIKTGTSFFTLMMSVLEEQ